MANDSDDFFRSILTGMAIRNEALLNAVVGFAAYHYTLKSPNGRIKEFLQYYNRSVSLLLAHLKRKEKHTVATLLTILQLATIEVSRELQEKRLDSNHANRSTSATGSISWATKGQLLSY